MAEANRNDSSTNSQSKQISGSQDGTVPQARVSVQGFKPLVGHFACLCRGFEIFFFIIFRKENGNIFTLLIIFILKSLQKEQKSTNLLL